MAFDILLLAHNEGQVIHEIAHYLAPHGFQVRPFHSLDEMCVYIGSGGGDAILLSMTHQGRPEDAVRRVRELTGKPVLVIHVPDEQDRALDLLDLGANDFVCRDVTRDNPISLRELRTRLSSVIRLAARRDLDQTKLLTIGEIVIDTADHRVWRGDTALTLTQTEYRLLLQLATNPNDIIPHADLLRDVWSDQQKDKLVYLRTYISRLRKKLEWDHVDREGPQIRAQRGVGYGIMLHAKRTEDDT